MNRMIIRLILNVAALYLVIKLPVPGIAFDGQWWALVVIAVIFGLVNALIRPVLLGLSCLFNILTLGLFTFVINALMLLLTAWISDQVGKSLGFTFTIDGFISAFLGALVITIFSAVLSHLIREKRR
jgi:putative membrane protein